MKYQNIVSSSEVFHKYWIIGEYDNLDKAMKNIDEDIEQFKKQYPKFWKREYPTHSATIKNPEFNT